MASPSLNPSPAQRNRIRARTFALLSGVLVIVIGLCALMEWMIDFPSLMTVLPEYIRMKANTALGFVCGGLGLLLAAYPRRPWNRRLLAVLSTVTALIGAATTAEYLFHWDLHLDQLLLNDSMYSLFPGRMAPLSAINFALIGVSEFCLALHRPARRTSQTLALLTTFGALLSIAGHVYGVPEFYGGGSVNYTSMALHIGVAFTILGVGLLCVAPRHGFMRLFWGDSVGGLMMRHLAPAAVFIPCLLGALTTTRWFSAGDLRLKVAILVLSNVLCFVAMIWLIAQHLHASEAERTAIQRKLLLSRTKYATELEQTVQQRTYELEKALTRTNAILESAADGMFGIDIYGHISFVNPAALTMLRASADDLLGHDFELVIPHFRADGNLYPSLQMPIYAAMAEDRVIVVQEDLLQRRDGNQFPINGVATSIRAGGKLLGAMLAFRDVSASIRLERIKSEFVSVVSHELRTPLTSIRGSLGLVASGKLGELSERASHVMQIAVSNTDRLARLINDILDVERMDSGKLLMNKRQCSTKDLAEQAAESVRWSAEQSLITLSLDVEETSIRADADRMVQVLTNLMVNAIKFSPPHTTVFVQCKAQDDRVLFLVKDEGRGIPADKIDLIFERFQQIDSSDSREKGGCGLGLAIARGIVVQHGGSIWVESTPGEGSMFCFAIPHTHSAPRTQTAENCETLI